MPPSVPPEDHRHLDTEMTEMTGLAFDPEWLDDYAWAATELGSPAPDFSESSLPAIGTQDRALSTTPSGSSTAAEQDPAILCKNANKQQRSCISIITGILGSMGSSSSLCIMGNREDAVVIPSSLPPPRTAPTSSIPCVDAVLSAAQEANCLLRGLLDCPTCRAGPQLQLLLTVAFAEVVSRYQRVISTYRNLQREKTGPLQSHGDLKRTPLSIGSHLIEGSMEAMLVGRVIMSRLQKLEVVMGETLVVPAAQFEGQCARDLGGIINRHNSENLKGLLGEMYKRRGLYLAEQLAAAKQELTELLAQCEPGVGCLGVP
ncbi:hypothetical protein V8F20_007895 [Naviculisporaceae sp. PSN 640]